VPWLDGKSSVGRLGIRIHATAGRGDAGFMNHWTLEIDCVQPVRIYKGMPIGQLTYFMTGPIDTPYNNKAFAKYNQRSPLPVASAMHLNFDKETGRWK
jgi:dCTP deaminase